MHHGVLSRNGEYTYLDRRFFNEQPIESLRLLTDHDVSAMLIAAEPALSKLEEHGALAQWFLQRLNQLSGGHLTVKLDEDLAGWFTLDVLIVRNRQIIGRLEFDGSDLHLDCLLHGDDLRTCNEALHKLIQVCVREIQEVQELPASIATV